MVDHDAKQSNKKRKQKDPQQDRSEKKKNEEALEKQNQRRKESSLVKKIVFSILFIGFVLLMTVGFVGYNYVKNALQPLDPADPEQIEVEIPMDTSTKGIAQILEKEAIIKNATVFNYYMKTKNAAEFQAGFYEFSPSMELDEIITVLEKGGTTTPVSEDYKILVKEGATLEEIAEEFAAKTRYSKQDFLDVVTNDTFIKELSEAYPRLLSDAINKNEVKYKLEGYLFPATYDYLSHYTIEEVVQAMVEKTNEVVKPYRQEIEEKGWDIHSILTLASLVEKEGIKYEDRKKIAGVFYNRLEADMPLQSDISVLYALNKHLEFVTVENTEVDSPYNLYMHKGLGPGPFDNPSEEAIQATLDPEESDYYYFLADIKTGEVYYSKTFEEHLELQEQYIDDVPSE